jgi:Mn-containing catalase
MFISINKVPNPIPRNDKPNPKAAHALQEGLGGQFGEMRTICNIYFRI